jgi:hypothetical protein
MKIPEKFLSDANAMPAALRDLLEAELAAGNEISEVFHSFPAPPVGACFLLKRAVTTRPRASSGGISFYERNSSSYSGEFTDAQRFFFVLEPPHPPPAEPDSDAIRDARTSGSSALPAATAARAAAAAATQDAVRRFEESMAMDLDKWRDGSGYDLEILRTSTPDDRSRIEDLLVARGVRDWRDAEALAAVDSARARAVLAEAASSADPNIQTAVARYAPEIAGDHKRIAALITALETAEVYGGLTQALLDVEDFHPPEVIDALFRGVLARDGATAGEFAAMLMYLHGKADAAYDFELRPFFLQFQDGDREALFRDLCERVGVDPSKYL